MRFRIGAQVEVEETVGNIRKGVIYTVDEIKRDLCCLGGGDLMERRVKTGHVYGRITGDNRLGHWWINVRHLISACTSECRECKYMCKREEGRCEFYESE